MHGAAPEDHGRGQHHGAVGGLSRSDVIAGRTLSLSTFLQVPRRGNRQVLVSTIVGLPFARVWKRQIRRRSILDTRCRHLSSLKFVPTPSQDSLSQYVAPDRETGDTKEGHNWARTARMVSFGAFLYAVPAMKWYDAGSESRCLCLLIGFLVACFFCSFGNLLACLVSQQNEQVRQPNQLENPQTTNQTTNQATSQATNQTACQTTSQTTSQTSSTSQPSQPTNRGFIFF